MAGGAPRARARPRGSVAEDIASELFGQPSAAEAWAGPSDFMRSRVRRLLRFAEAMTQDGYRQVLSGRPIATPEADPSRR